MESLGTMMLTGVGRNKKGRAAVLVFLVWCSLMSEFASAQTDVARLCAGRDLVGTWEMAGISTATTVDRSDPFYFPHQRFIFYENGSARHITSSKPLTPAEYQMMTIPPATTAWKIDDRGGLALQKAGMPYSEWSLCTYGLKDVPDPSGGVHLRAGDVVLTSFDQGGRPVLKRVLRKVAVPKQPISGVR